VRPGAVPAASQTGDAADANVGRNTSLRVRRLSVQRGTLSFYAAAKEDLQTKHGMFGTVNVPTAFWARPNHDNAHHLCVSVCSLTKVRSFPYIRTRLPTGVEGEILQQGADRGHESRFCFGRRLSSADGVCRLGS
jgi:hypothetical protein